MSDTVCHRVPTVNGEQLYRCDPSPSVFSLVPVIFLLIPRQVPVGKSGRIYLRFGQT